MVLIKLENIEKTFKDKMVFKNLNFEVKQNEVIGIIGANGIGKSTILKIICGLGNPDKGKIKYFYDYEKNPVEKIGFLFQESKYPAPFTVKDVIQIISSKLQDRKRLNHLINLMGIKKIMKRKIFKLSGGEKQKVNLLVAMYDQPKILLLDEFSTSLDILAKKNIIEYLQKIRKEEKITGLIVSHDVNEIISTCSHFVVLKNNKLGEKNKISKNTTPKQVLSFLD